MPTMPQEQLDEIELTIQDLLDQLEDQDALKRENAALRAENLRLNALLKTD